MLKKWAQKPWKFGVLSRFSIQCLDPQAVSAAFLGPEEEESLYKVGDKVVYPHHGAGTVVKKEKRTILGTEREYLTIKILA